MFWIGNVLDWNVLDRKCFGLEWSKRSPKLRGGRGCYDAVDAAAAPLHHRRAAVEGVEAVKQTRARLEVHLALSLIHLGRGAAAPEAVTADD